MNDAKSIRNHAQRQGAIGVMVHTDGRLLVIKRSQTVRAPGRFCFPSGGIEQGETQADAVRRELHEELNVEVHPIRCLWQSETKSGVLLHWWLVDLPADQVLKPNPDEVAACFWMSRKEIVLRPETLSTNQRFLEAVASGEVTLE